MSGLSVGIIVLIAGLFLVAWGQFGDRVRAALGIGERGPLADSGIAESGAIKDIPAIVTLLGQLSDLIKNINGSVNEHTREIAKIFNSVSEQAERLDAAERDVVRNNSKIYSFQRGSLTLADYAEHAVRLDIIRSLLRSPPDLEDAFA